MWFRNVVKSEVVDLARPYLQVWKLLRIYVGAPTPQGQGDQPQRRWGYATASDPTFRILRVANFLVLTSC
jgi:hypothetical protein